MWGISEHVLNVEDATPDFCRDVLSGVIELFPGPYVHCGGDECPKTEWEASDTAQARIRALGLAGEDELQAWFSGQMAAHLAANGRRFVGWDEVLEGGGQAALPDDAVVMSWRSEAGAVEAARNGRDVVMAPQIPTHFGRYQGPWYAKAARHRWPEHARDRLRLPAGAQAHLWTEYVPDPAHAEYMLFPRLCAFAEAVWRDRSAELDYGAFLDRLRPHLTRLDQLGVNYRPLDD